MGLANRVFIPLYHQRTVDSDTSYEVCLCVCVLGEGVKKALDR